jgi:Tol biopolymer transport system component
MLTPEEIASSEEITGLSLSSDASLVVYSVGSRSRTGDHATSALWLAETDIRGSARQFTSGEFHDRSPAFHPDGSDIYFLSDRHGSGGPAQIYRVRVSSPVELVLVTSPITAAGISSFSISPNGRYIAFISPDKFLDGMKDATADPEIWGDKRDLGRLRLLDLADASKR